MAVFIPFNTTCGSTPDCMAAFPQLNVQCYAGLCGCHEGFAMDGVNCATPTPASLGTSLVLGLALACVVLTAIRFSVGFWRAVYHHRLKYDVASFTYLTSWLNIVSVCLECGALFCLSLDASVYFLRISDAAWYLGMIFLTSSLVFMELSFVQMTKMSAFALCRALRLIRSLCLVQRVTTTAWGKRSVRSSWPYWP